MATKRTYEERTCPICGETYLARKDKKGVYCSYACAGKARSERERKYAICPVCGETFCKRRSERIYCSKECQHKGARKRTIITCDECGTQFERVNCHIKKHNFCSRECMSRWQEKNTEGENSAKWRGGVSLQDEYIFLREGKRKYRAEHRIVVENFIGRRLRSDEIVHHIDGNKQNNEISNLAILTRAEHARLHAQMRKEKGKAPVGAEKNNSLNSTTDTLKAQEKNKMEAI